ncbi:acyl CoA binding protein-domain-containing protein [Gaertneriomyces semiglobifer]|nr:acyl CoA binding protein-domain-containing protein [Gaertneriomyces semiglobifer]
MEQRFLQAVSLIQAVPKEPIPGVKPPSDKKKVELYGLYKQATVGPCDTQRPGWFDVAGRYKWDAWSKLGKLSKEQAMQSYVELSSEVLQPFSTLSALEVHSYTSQQVSSVQRQHAEAFFKELKRFLNEANSSDEEDRFSFEDVESKKHSPRSIPSSPSGRSWPTSPSLGAAKDIPTIPDSPIPVPARPYHTLPSPTTPPVDPPPEFVAAMAEEVLAGSVERQGRLIVQEEESVQPIATRETTLEDISKLLSLIAQKLERLDRRVIVLEEERQSQRSKRNHIAMGTLIAAAPLVVYGVWQGIAPRKR